MRVGLKKVLFGALPVAAGLLIVPVASADGGHRFQERYIYDYSPDSGYYSDRAHRSDRGHHRFHRDLRRTHRSFHRDLRRTQRRYYDYGYRGYDRDSYYRRYNRGASCRYRPYRSYGRWYR